MDVVSIGMLLSCALVAILLVLSRKESVSGLKGQYLRHSTIVILGYTVVHFQMHVDYLLGFVDSWDPYIWVNPEIVIKSLAVSVSGLIFFLIGYLGYKEKNASTNRQSDFKVYRINLIGFVSVILLVMYFYFANPLYLLGYYGAERLGVEAAYIVLLFKAVVFASLIQTARNLRVKDEKFVGFVSYVKANSFLINCVLLIYLASVMISGDRGPLMHFSIAYFACYMFVTRNKVNIVGLVTLVFIGAYFITSLGKVRSMDRGLPFSERFVESLSLESRFETRSVLPQTQELASSIRALHHTVNYIPSDHDYLYGRFQFQQVLSIFPFGNSIVQLIFEDNSYKYGGSSRFITWIILGDQPYMGHGSSVTSDFYFDFGLIGVLLGMFLFGYSIRFAEVKMYSSGLPTIFENSFFVVFISSAIYISRSTYLIEMKAVFFVFLILLFNQKVLNRSK